MSAASRDQASLPLTPGETRPAQSCAPPGLQPPGSFPGAKGQLHESPRRPPLTMECLHPIGPPSPGKGRPHTTTARADVRLGMQTTQQGRRPSPRHRAFSRRLRAERASGDPPGRKEHPRWCRYRPAAHPHGSGAWRPFPEATGGDNAPRPVRKRPGGHGCRRAVDRHTHSPHTPSPRCRHRAALVGPDRAAMRYGNKETRLRAAARAALAQNRTPAQASASAKQRV